MFLHVALAVDSSPGSGAGSAEALEREFMLGQNKTVWKQTLQPPRASIDIVQSVAIGAVKVMMVLVGDFGGLVSIRMGGECHCRDLIFVLELSHDAIDRAKSDRLHLSRGFSEYLVDRQWATCALNRFANGIKLDRVSSFGHGRSLYSALFECWFVAYMVLESNT